LFSLLDNTIPVSGGAHAQSASMNGVSGLSNETKFRKIMQTTESRPTSREKEKGRDGEEVVALSRGLDVLRRIAAADAPVSNRELAEWTGIPKPTISRLTATLVSANLLFQLPDSERFVLTASVLELATVSCATSTSGRGLGHSLSNWRTGLR